MRELVARLGQLELAVNRRKHAADRLTEGEQDGDGHHRDEREDERIFHEGLALLALETAQRSFGARNNFVDHLFFHLLPLKNLFL